MNQPPIQTASVKVMRSHDYCHFEVCLSTSQIQVGLSPNSGLPITPDQVDELRKTAARLADKAVAQYRVAKINAARRLSEKYERAAVVDRVRRIREIKEGERTANQQAELKAFDDETWAESRAYGYEDDWGDDDDEG